MSELYELIEIKQGIKDVTEDECAIDRIRIICMLEHILTVQYNEISINHKKIKNVYDYIPEYKTKYGNHISTLEREALGCVYDVFKRLLNISEQMDQCVYCNLSCYVGLLYHAIANKEEYLELVEQFFEHYGLLYSMNNYSNDLSKIEHALNEFKNHPLTECLPLTIPETESYDEVVPKTKQQEKKTVNKKNPIIVRTYNLRNRVEQQEKKKRVETCAPTMARTYNLRNTKF